MYTILVVYINVSFVALHHIPNHFSLYRLTSPGYQLDLNTKVTFNKSFLTIEIIEIQDVIQPSLNN